MIKYMPQKPALRCFPLIFILLFSTFTLAIKSYGAKEDVIYDEDQKYQSKTYEVQNGDGVIKILERHGVSGDKAHKAYASHPFTEDFRFIKGNRYLVMNSLAKDGKKFRFYCPYTDNVYTLSYNKEDLQWSTEKSNLDIEIEYAQGTVEGSLLASITQKIPSDLVAYRFMDAYLLDFNIRRDVQRGAPFALHVEKQFDQGHFIRYGEVLNTSLEVKGKKEDRNFIRFPGGGVFARTQGVRSDRPFYSPVNYQKITSTFKPRRFHPIRRKTIAHLGMDFALPEGEPIFAPQEGVIHKMGKNRAAGRFVVLKHKNGLVSYYNHMSLISPKLYKGMTLQPGDKIGEIGCTGYCTLPHLHFAVKKNGRFIDPAPLVRSYPYEARRLFEEKTIH